MPAAVAFCFAPANDSEPDPMARKLKAEGLGSIGADDRASDAPDGPLAAPYRLMALAGSLFLEGLFRMHLPAGHGEFRHRARQP